MATTKQEQPSDPVLSLCRTIDTLVAELSARAERDNRLIKMLCDTVILQGQSDLQIRRIELETTGTAQARAADAYRAAMQNGHLNGTGVDPEADLTIPGRA